MSMYSLKARLLYKFLMKNRALHLFVQEVMKQKVDYRIVKEFKQEKKNVMDLLGWFNDINESLYWVQTTQGHYFWKKLNDEYYMFYKRYEELLLKG